MVRRFGKTRQILATADTYLKLNPNAKVLLITKSKTIIADTFTKDTQSVGIDLSRFIIGTYDGIGNETVDPFTVLVAFTGQTPETQQRAVITVQKNLITRLNLTYQS
jgi:hypothetical protein